MGLIEKIINEEIESAQKIIEWPESYVHRLSNKVYTPHNESEYKFVYEDSPRFSLILGGEGCTSGETLVNNIPIAEWSGGNLFTLGGLCPSTKAYPKGTADLYRVQTKSGRVVVATLQHRFLTPIGWNQLQNLSVGHLIAVRDKLNGPFGSGISTGYSDRYLSGSHPYGVLSSPQVTDAQDKLRQLANSLYGPLNPVIFDSLRNSHSYKKHYLHQWEQLQQHPFVEYFYVSCGDGKFPLEYQIVLQLLQEIAHLYTFLSFLEGFLNQSSSKGVDFLQFPSDADDRQLHHQLVQQFYQYLHPHNHLGQVLKSQLSFLLNSLLNYNTGGQPLGVWDEIVDIQFNKHTEYYDLTVPFAEHYLTNGIYSHNSGKSVALIIKILNRLKRGCNGAVISPNMPSFRRSLFPELLNWLPRSVVIDNHQRFFTPGWRPRESFIIVVHNELGGYSELMCASSESPRLLEGPNLNFAAMDEIRGMPDSEVLKVMAGRCRINGKNGEPFQLFCSSTPAMHWMYEMYGPVKEDDTEEIKDFKSQTYVARISVQENIDAGNIPEGFIESRGAVLTEAEKRVRIHGEWANEDNPDRFIPDMLRWDNLYDPQLQPVRPKNDPNRNWSDAMLLAIDASVSRDYTALVGVTRDPKSRDRVAVRLVKVWKPVKDGMIDFLAVQEYITNICKRYHTVMLIYDSFQMEQMAQSLYRGGVVAVKRFSQQAPRTIADQFLFDSIYTGSICHMGDGELRKHLDHADVQIDDVAHKKRIVKRSKGLKIDAAVALSMANYECKRLNI